MNEQLQDDHIKKVVVIGEMSMIAEVSPVIFALGYSSQLISLPMPPPARSARFEQNMDGFPLKMEEIFEQFDIILTQKDKLSIILILNNSALACFCYDFITDMAWHRLFKLMKAFPSIILCNEEMLTSKNKLQNYLYKLYDVEKNSLT